MHGNGLPLMDTEQLLSVVHPLTEVCPSLSELFKDKGEGCLLCQMNYMLGFHSAGQGWDRVETGNERQ